MSNTDIFAGTETADASRELPPLAVSDAAVARIDHIRRTTPSQILVISVTPGGCSGFLYNFGLVLSVPAHFDVFAGGRVACDPVSAGILSGSVLDFETSLTGSRFVIRPDKKLFHQCSCGVSFGKITTS